MSELSNQTHESHKYIWNTHYVSDSQTPRSEGFVLATFSVQAFLLVYIHGTGL